MSKALGGKSARRKNKGDLVNEAFDQNDPLKAVTEIHAHGQKDKDNRYVTEDVMLDQIALQENNPRWKGLRAPTLDEVRAGATAKFPDIEDEYGKEAMGRFVEHIRSLAASIREHGIVHMPIVKEVGADRYELLDGDNRILAARYEGLQTVSVRIQANRQKDPLTIQFLSNNNRKNWAPSQAADAIRRLLEQKGIEGAPSADEIQAVTNLPTRTCYVWASIFSHPDDLLPALIDGRVKTLAEAERISKFPLRSERKTAIEQGVEAVESGPTEKATRPAAKPDPVKPKSVGGRKKTKVTFGAVKDVSAARFVIDAVAEKVGVAVPDDLSDFDSMQTFWNAILEQIQESKMAEAKGKGK